MSKKKLKIIKISLMIFLVTGIDKEIVIPIVKKNKRENTTI